MRTPPPPLDVAHDVVRRCARGPADPGHGGTSKGSRLGCGDAVLRDAVGRHQRRLFRVVGYKVEVHNEASVRDVEKQAGGRIEVTFERRLYEARADESNKVWCRRSMTSICRPGRVHRGRAATGVWCRVRKQEEACCFGG